MYQQKSKNGEKTMTEHLTRSQYIHKRMLENCVPIYPVVKFINNEDYNEKMLLLESKRKYFSDEYDNLAKEKNKETLNLLKYTSDIELFKKNYPLTYEVLTYKSMYHSTFKEFFQDSDLDDVLYNLMKELPHEIYLQIIIQQNVKEFICEILNNDECSSRELLEVNLKRRLLSFYKNVIQDLFTELKQSEVINEQDSLLP